MKAGVTGNAIALVLAALLALPASSPGLERCPRGAPAESAALAVVRAGGGVTLAVVKALREGKARWAGSAGGETQADHRLRQASGVKYS